MIVVEQARALALKLNNPERVLSTIPTARMLHRDGIDLTIVPHKLDEVKVLRNLGIKAPSPILYYYDWPGRFKPYEHQRKTAEFLTFHKRGLVLNEIGTGKSISALWAADYLMERGDIKKVLIVSPLSTLERVWGDAIFSELVHRKAVTLHGTSERRMKLLKTDADFFIINHDGFGIIADATHGMFDLVIIDEAAVLRNPGTKKFKIFRRWLQENPATRAWLMTGTPTPNEPTDAWALARLIDSPMCTMPYTAFREKVMQRMGPYRLVPRLDATEIASKILQPSVRFTRDECFDLPETVVQTRKVMLTPEQEKHYKTMMKTLIADLAGGQITAANDAVKALKLIQICCGVAYGEDGKYIHLDCAPRVRAVREVIEEIGDKVIIFVPLTGTLHMLEEELSKDYTVGVVNGEVSSSKRDVIFHNFQNTKDPHILIAHPATMAHGLTLTSARTIIWYGPITSNETYVQACGRIERIGKKYTSNIIHIESTELEHRMYERLKNKQNVQGVLLDLIQQQRV